MSTYECVIDSPDGYCVARCTDEQIDRLPEGSIARFLRDELRAGVYVTPAEIAKAYFGGRRDGRRTAKIET